jgi:hypothetical protein
MAFVAVATGVGAAVGLSGTAALIGGGALIGAGVGGLYSGITGDGNILNSMLTGGLIGGAGAGLMGAFGAGAAGTQAGTGLTPTLNTAAALPSTATVPSANVLTGTAAQKAGYGAMSAAKTAAPSFSSAAGVGSNLGAIAAPTSAATTFAPVVTGPLINPASIGTVSKGLTGSKMLGYGLAGTTAMQLLGGGKGAQAPESATYPGDIRPYEFSARPTSGIGESAYPTTQYDMAGNPMLDTAERSYFDQGYTPLQAYRAGTANPNPVMVAQGGLMAAYPMEKYGNSIPNTETYGIGMAKGGQVKRMFGGGMSPIWNAMIEQSSGAVNQNPQISTSTPKYEYNAANQTYKDVTPTGNLPGLLGLFSTLGLDKAQGLPQYTYNPQEQSYTALAAGGQTSSLGSYSDGGRMLKGPGDGMSDHIPGIIGGKQPARLADGEFVVPADVVSHLGNGSTDAGAKRLYAMMDTVRKARTGNKKQGKQIKAEKYLPA